MRAWHFASPQNNGLLYGSATGATLVVGALLGGWVWHSLHTKPDAPEIFLQVRLFKASAPSTLAPSSGPGNRDLPKPSRSTAPQPPLHKRITTGAKPLTAQAAPPVSPEAPQASEAESTDTGVGGDSASPETGSGNETGGGGRTGAAVDPTPVEAPKPKVVPAILVKKDKLSGEDPHLPHDVKIRYRHQKISGAYKICISTDGTINSVTPLQEIMGADENIVATLKEWKYRPQRIPLCFVQGLEFHIE